MAIRVRRGLKADFDPNKLVEGELATPLDTKELYAAFAPGDVQRIATFENVHGMVEEATEDIVEEITDNVNKATDYATEQGEYAKGQAEYATEQGEYATEQGNYAKDQGDYAKEQGEIAEEATSNLKEYSEFVYPNMYIDNEGFLNSVGGENIEFKIDEEGYLVSEVIING